MPVPVPLVTVSMCYSSEAPMKTATVRDLRNHDSKLMKWLAAGEEILMTRRGQPIARLTPEMGRGSEAVDWCQSAAVTRDRSQEPCLDAHSVRQVLRDASGTW